MGENRRLSKLTEREKECLRAWLDHKTAKEIAIDLGISHHAVEKRLKMARIKLDVANSIDAARLLGEAEGYGQTVVRSADLPTDAATTQPWFTKRWIMGAMVMSIISAIVLAVVMQSGGPAVGSPTGVGSPDNDDIPKTVLAQASHEQVEDFVSSLFAEFDKDRSGFIEEAEGPRSIQLGCCSGDPNGELTGAAAWRRFLEDNADDGDNRVSFAEFHDTRFARLLKNGIPVEREKLVVTGERSSPYREQQPGEEEEVVVRRFEADMEFVKASPERVRVYVRRMFDAMDKDESGYIEMAEAPDRLGWHKAKMTADGTAVYDRNDPMMELTGDEARAQYIKNVDGNADGQVSFEEYAKPVMPQYLERGIPLIPADWTAAQPEASKGG